jgi:hypothetical protein
LQHANQGKIYQMITKCTKRTSNIPNGHKMYQTDIKYTKWPLNVSKFFVSRLSYIYPNLSFWSTNLPSGNPARHQCCQMVSFQTKSPYLGKFRRTFQWKLLL